MPDLRKSVVGTYLLHLRPRSFPIVFAHCMAGALAFVGQVHAGGRSAALVRAAVGAVLWAVCLNGGTLALNSAYDRDEGDVGYLDNPPPVPRGLMPFSVLLMVGGFLAAFAIHWTFAAAYAVSFVMSWIYSVPPLRLKAVAGMDLLINMAGYGCLTFAAGALAVGAGTFSLQAKMALWMLAASFAFLFGAFYPMTQIYQIPEDKARGDNTLVIRFGAGNALLFSIVAEVICAALQIIPAVELRLAGWAILLVVAANAAWIGFTLNWLRRLGSYPSQAGMYRALKLWAISDIAVVVAFGLSALR